MATLTKRVAALEEADAPQGMVLHCPREGDDHAAIAAQFDNRQTVGVVRFPGLNDGAVAAFRRATEERA